MAGIGGSHVRAATAFIRSERFLRYSPAAQSLWLHIQGLAVDLKCEFLPEEYTTEAIARSWGQPIDVVTPALDELVAKHKRPIVNALDVDFGEGPVTLIRARGAREKQPVGWKDEVDLARLWNTDNPEDLVVLEGFERRTVNQRAERGGSQPEGKKRVPQTSSKRTANAKQTRSKRGAVVPQTVGETLANASHLCDRREDKKREQGHSQSECEAGDSTELPTGSDDAGNNGNGNDPDPRLVSRFDKLVVGWGTAAGDDEVIRRRATMFLSADPPRILAHVLEIESNVAKFPTPWPELGRRLTKVEKPNDTYYDRAKELIKAVTS